MTDDSFQTRPMTPADIALAVDWAAAEGWNPGLADAACFAATDPEGFIGGWLDGRMIASISAVNYGPDFAFLGFYIVAPEFRGQGYGYRLWQAAMAHVAGRTVGLDGVVDQQANYRKSGFELAYRNIRHGGVPRPGWAQALPAPPQGLEIAPAARADGALLAYDRAAFPAARQAFLSGWLSAPGHVAKVARRHGGVAGYGVIRPCRAGHKIGPLFAEDPSVAIALLSALLDAADIGDTQVFLDTPEPNRPAVALAQSLGLAPVFETARMYAGPSPAVALDRVFGVTTFELG